MSVCELMCVPESLPGKMKSERGWRDDSWISASSAFIKRVSGSRCGRRFFIASAGSVRTSSRIHVFRRLAFSTGRNMEQRDQRNKRRTLFGAERIICIMLGSSCHATAGIGVVIGGAKTRLRRSTGLCWMYPAQTARSSISRSLMRMRLSVARCPASSIDRTAWITSGAVTSSTCLFPSG